MLKLPFQMEFIINLTYRCNFACNMCTQYGGVFKNNSLNEMTAKEWDQFFESIKDINPKPQITLMGGEPLLYEEFDKVLEFASKKKFQVHIVTNGYYLEEHLEVIAKCGASISLSIDGLGDIHNNIRNSKTSFEKIERALKKIKEINVGKKRIKLCINSVILPDNIDGMLDFIVYMQQYKPDVVGFQHMQFSSDKLDCENNKKWQELIGEPYTTTLKSKKEYSFDREYVEKLNEIIMRIRRKYKPDKVYDFPHLTEEELFNYYLEKDLSDIRMNRVCVTPWVAPSISPDGIVANCICNSIGNLRENNFWDIWNNRKANRLRDALTTNGKFPVCSRCCCFYKSNFLVAPDKKLELKNGDILIFPSILNYVRASNKGVFIYNTDLAYKNSEKKGQIPVTPYSIHSNKEKHLIEKTQVIVGWYDDIK